MTMTAAHGLRGPQRRGRILMAKTAASRRSKCRARVISKDSEDHDIGRCLNRRVCAQEFIIKRLNLSLDYSAVQKKGASDSGTASTAL